MDSRRAGLAAIAGAGAAIAGNTALLLIEPVVADDQVSFPLSPGAFTAGQVWFALTRVLMTLGVVGLVRSGAAGTGRAATVFGRLTVIGMAITVLGELLLVTVATQDVDSGATAAVSSVFGLGLLIADIGLIGFGLGALRRRVWPLPWRALLVVLGLFEILVVTPVSLALGFASVASYLAIATSNLLFALVGVALLRQPAQGSRDPGSLHPRPGEPAASTDATPPSGAGGAPIATMQLHPQNGRTSCQ